jgi:hypothetical protein
MSKIETPSHPTSARDRRSDLAAVATATSAMIALFYGLLFAGVLSVDGADEAGRAILGVAGGVFLFLAILLWFVRSRWLWAGAALLQALMAMMYVTVAPEREPSFEVWGLTIRALSAVLLVVLILLLVSSWRDRNAAS